ncbi:MAG: DoxX family protein [Myxococcaceae bacterium]|jgi:putative oxidoreductase|nr:DoxX family protein [Myxococcaceae bacterium]
MNLLLWIVQGLLALIFLAHGLLFVTLTPARIEKMAKKRKPNAPPPPKMPNWLLKLIGTSEILAAPGLILPVATGILPWLTPLAAFGLAITMLGAVALHAKRREVAETGATVLLLLLSLLVIVMRWPTAS